MLRQSLNNVGDKRLHSCAPGPIERGGGPVFSFETKFVPTCAMFVIVAITPLAFMRFSR